MIKKLLICTAVSLFLGLHEGHLALTDGSNAYHIFPYKAELYTDTDRALLKEGIPLPDREKLSSLLEDYFS